ncbi:MAG: hypothetical protein H6595_10780 [Flavobacteriales bacterium]|nr:hypothetical protein [Flavobacteriales bacterium]MCB9167946.1 hypothetical protein [Flavobacteriales bacterium]
MRRILILFGTLIAFLEVGAQPFQYGCHYFRNRPSVPRYATDAERTAMNASIARSDTFDILHYDIAIDVTRYDAEEILAATTISYVPLMAGQTFIRFDLYQLAIDSVIGENGPLVFHYDGAIIKVDLDQAPAIGSTHEMTLYYHGVPHRDPDWGGFYFESGYIYNLGIGLTTIPPNFGKVWYPCFDSFVERATYTYHVKSAGTYRAHCQGTDMGETIVNGDTVVHTFSLNANIPTHLSAIAVANYQDSDRVHTGAFGDINVRLTAKPNQLNAMVNKMVDVDDAIDVLEYWYGPYPYERVGYVLTTDGALEIPTNIAYPDFMPGQTLTSNRDLLTHELGHHWWGDRIAPYDHSDMWFKEGPAEYATHLIAEWQGGQEALEEAVKDNMLYVLEQANVQDGGFQALSPMPDPYIYGLTTYYKGAAVIHNLRGYLGDAPFRQAMTAIQADHADESMSAVDLKNALEAETGLDLDPFFDAWVFAPGFSVFVVHEMDAQPNGTQWDVQLTLRQGLRGTTAYHHQVPLDLTLIGSDWQRQEYQVVGDDEWTTVNVPCDFQPAFAVLNGHARLNQARMDHEFTIRPGQSFPSLLPWVDMRIYTDNVPDSALMHVEHVWSGPDNDQMGWGIDQISSTHYWRVEGIWPAGLQVHGKLYYFGSLTTDLDNDLYGVTEQDAELVYRARPTDPWEVYGDYTLNAGSLNNGVGSFDIDSLRRGEYAFAKGQFAAMVSGSAAIAGSALSVHPSPASDLVQVQGVVHTAQKVRFEIIAANGGLMKRVVRQVSGAFDVHLDVASLASGPYVIRMIGPDGRRLGEKDLMIAR